MKPQNVDLRNQISHLLQELDYQAKIMPQVTFRVNDPVAYIKQLVRLERTGPDQPAGAEHLIYEFDSLCQDKRFAASISAVREITVTLIFWNRSIAKQIATLLDSLREEQLRRGWSQN